LNPLENSPSPPPPEDPPLKPDSLTCPLCRGTLRWLRELPRRRGPPS
jgi:hypothetical protein